jgi:hypothetical protein
MSLHPLIEEALEAHGGTDRWRHYRGVSSTIVTGGQLWSIKQAPLIAGPRRATIQFDPQRTEVTPFGQPGRTMHWTPDRIEVTDAEDMIVAARDHPRDAIDRSFDAAWDPLNLAYFNGYAMWTYHAVPFVFSDPSYLARDIEPVRLDGEILRGVAVRFPDGIHSHSREQRFYFGADGLLRRHDYEVEHAGRSVVDRLCRRRWPEVPHPPPRLSPARRRHVGPQPQLCRDRSFGLRAARRRLSPA